jgi:hypothetical protein
MIRIHLEPEVEARLTAEAKARGMALELYLANKLSEADGTDEPGRDSGINPDAQTGAALVEAMQACPYPDVDISPPRIPSPLVRDVNL